MIKHLSYVVTLSSLILANSVAPCQERIACLQAQCRSTMGELWCWAFRGSIQLSMASSCGTSKMSRSHALVLLFLIVYPTWFAPATAMSTCKCLYGKPASTNYLDRWMWKTSSIDQRATGKCCPELNELQTGDPINVCTLTLSPVPDARNFTACCKAQSPEPSEPYTADCEALAAGGLG